MSKNHVSFDNRDRFIQVGIAIAVLRKVRGLSQYQLASKAGISRSHLSAIEAPGIIRGFSMDALFNIADTLDVEPVDLLEQAASMDALVRKKKHPPSDA